MLTSGTIQRTIGTTKQHGAKNAVFYTFFSKKATPPFSPTDCTQTISAKIPCLSFTGKERDEETGYGYFGARYMDHELTAMWLSVDPMADKYPSISPYAYCAWNPIKLVDPDGNEAIDNDDWYINSKGEAKWFNSTAEKITYEGEEYTRYGQTASMTNSDGEFVYGDQYGNTHSSKSLKEVSVTENLTDFERTMSNPLVQSIHRSAAEFWGTALDIGIETGAQSFTYCGLGVQTIGFYCLAIPGGEAIGTELFAVGNALSSIGIGFDAINNIRKGDLTGLALDAVSIAAPRGISKQIDKGVSSGFLSATPKDINLINSYISTRTGYITETFNIGRKK